jgi:hypothetical protein
MHFRLFVPGQTVGASAVHWDLFNAANSGLYLAVQSVSVVVDGSVAVVGVVGVTLFLTRTTAIGTGGTAATREGTALTAATFSAHDHSAPLDSTITARLTPTGGATAGSVLASRCVFTEETNSAAYQPAIDMVRPWLIDCPALIVNQGTGIRVVQSSVASVGVVGYDVLFDVRQRP